MNSPSPDYVLGIDIGTGSCKGLAIDLKGNKLADSNSFYSIQSRQEGYAEQDPEEIWTAFKDCFKNILEKTGHAPHAVSFSSAMHSLLLIDDKNNSLTPLIIWADKRSEDIATGLRKKKIAASIYKATGTPIYSMSPLCKIIWFKENQPDLFQKTAKFVSIKEFIWFRLFHEWQVDMSIASATGLFNIHTFQWHQPSLNLCGIYASQLSAIVPTVLTRTKSAERIFQIADSKQEIIFCIGANDGCLANLGSFALEESVGALTIGTSGAVRIAVKEPVSDFESMLFNYVLDSSTYISGGPINNGGIVVKWLLKTFLNIHSPKKADYDMLFKQISTVAPGSEGLVFLPYLLGERAPVWDADASALFFGITAKHTRNHFLRAAVEGICFAIKSVLQPIEEKIAPIRQLSISGGFINSPDWMQMMADITWKTLCLIENDDASSLGAAMLVMKELKLIGDYDDLKAEAKLIIHPDKNYTEIYEANFAVYKKLYHSLKDVMHKE